MTKQARAKVEQASIIVNGRKWTVAPRRDIVRGKTYENWLLTFYDAEGRRQRKTYPTQAGAFQARRVEVDRFNVDVDVQKILARRMGEMAKTLKDADLLDAADALAVLSGRASLKAAAMEYATRHPIGPSETVEATCQRYIEDMIRDSARPSSVADKKVKLRVFCRDRGTQPTASIDDMEIDAWCKRKAFSPATAHSYRSAVKTVLNFYHGRKRRRRAGDERLPTTWPVDKVKNLFAVAEKEYPEIIPAMVLLWFCGLRPDEMQRITWAEVSLDSRTVHVLPGIAKTRTSRIVDLAPNAIEWLMRYRGEGKIVSSAATYRRMRRNLLKTAEAGEWSKDVPRHTFATVHYKAHENLERTMEQLGHFGGSAMFRRHYKGQPVTREQAEAYWNIRPGEAKSIPFPVADAG